MSLSSTTTAGRVRGRADLRVLRSPSPPTTRPSPGRCAGATIRDAELRPQIRRVYRGQLRRLRGPQGVAPAQPRGHRCGRDAGGAADARAWVSPGGSGAAGAHNDPAPSRAAAGRSRRPAVPCPPPQPLWVADITYVATWSGFAYVAFVTDVFSRRIVGWRVVDQPAGRSGARRAGDGDLDAPGRGPRRPGASLRPRRAVLVDRLHRTPGGRGRGGVGRQRATPMTTPWPSRSTGSTSPSSSTTTGPWRTVEDVELATLSWVDWWNNAGCSSHRQRPAGRVRGRMASSANNEALCCAESDDLGRGGITAADETDFDDRSRRGHHTMTGSPSNPVRFTATSFRRSSAGQRAVQQDGLVACHHHVTKACWTALRRRAGSVGAGVAVAAR